MSDNPSPNSPEVVTGTTLLGNCGMVIFKKFGSSETLHKFVEFTNEEITAWLDKNEKHQREALGMAVAVITLNDVQMALMGQMFKDRGYKFSDPIWHPKHRTRLFLGHLAFHEDPGVDEVPMHDGEVKPEGWGDSDRIYRPKLYPPKDKLQYNEDEGIYENKYARVR